MGTGIGPSHEDHSGHDNQRSRGNAPFQRQVREPSGLEHMPLLHEYEADGGEDAAVIDDKVPSRYERSSTKLNAYGRRLWRSRNLIAVIILLLGGVIGLTVYFAVIDTDTHLASVSNVCLTPACVQAASVILSSMSPKYSEIDPCVDFNKFTCEGFVDTHDIRADQGALFASTIMAEHGQQILRRVLETPYSGDIRDFEAHSDAKEAIFLKLKNAYEACLDEDEIKNIGSAPLIKILEKVGELLPIEASSPIQPVQKRLESEEPNHLSQTAAFLTSIGVSAFIDFDVGADDRDPDTTIISVTAPRQPGLSSKEYYKDSAIVAKYTGVVGEVLEGLLREAQPSSSSKVSALGAIIESEKLAHDIVSLESALADATPDEEDAEDVTKYYNKVSVEEAQTLLPELSFSYLISTLSSSGCTPKNLIVGSPAYLKAVSKALNEASAETLRAYLVWKTVQSFAYQIDDVAVKPLKRFNNELQGKDPDAVQERWRTCISYVDRDLGWILSKFFVEEAFSKEAKDFGDRIVSEIKAQFVKRLGLAEWMTKSVRDLGIQKVHNIVQKIGYPVKSPDIRNSSDLQAYYQPVDITRDSYFENSVSVAKFSVKQEWSALCKPTDRAVWDMTADTVNAYYNPAGNEIVFPAGIMQAPVFYNPNVPQYLSYGAFGAISGHELSHAFDSTGRHYDETGNYTDWWDEKTVEAFTEKTQCFIEQYSNFTVKKPDGGELHVNGKLTLGENIADAGGINAAFASWKRSEEKTPGQLLPGLQQFTKEQLFFMSYSMFWCGKIRPETAVNLIYRDPHSPAWARIMGTTANSREFRKAFNCPVKEPTCELW